MAPPRILDPRREAKIAREYADGQSPRDLAAKYGINRSTVREVVLRQGGTMRPRGGVPGRSRRPVSV